MIYLVEIEVHDGVGVRTLYLSTEGVTTRPTDTPANAFYDPRIIDPGNFERFLFGAGTTRGASQVGGGEIVVASASPGNELTLDAWLNYSFNGRPITIKTLDSVELPISSARVLFRGTAEQLVADNPIDKVSIRLHDRLADLEKPLLTTKYAGTTVTTSPTAEGNVDLKDQIKPRIWGIVTNVPCVQVNVFDLIYQVSASAMNSITVFDGAIPLTLSGNYADVAALRSATILPGRYGTCLALGLFRLGAQPAATVTADVVQGSTAGQRTAAQIVRSMLLEFGIASSALPAASFAALDAMNSAQIGVRVDDETSALDAVNYVLGSISAWFAPDRFGVFYVGRLGPAVGPAVATYGDYEFIGEISRLPVLDDDKGIQSWRTTVKWGQSFTVQGENDVFGNATTARRSLVGTQWRESKIENAAIRAINPNAPEIILEGGLAYEADAIAEATRVQAYYGVRRDRYKFQVHISVAENVDLGSVIELRHPRLGLQNGKLFVVIGRTDEYVEDLVTFDVVG